MNWRHPDSFTQRRKNALGPLAVECQVSGRRLQFSPHSAILDRGEFITIDVVTVADVDTETGEDATRPKKICQLIVTRDELMNALSHVRPD